jgi:imidazolonepropionase-like amidohydrolase
MSSHDDSDLTGRKLSDSGSRPLLLRVGTLIDGRADEALRDVAIRVHGSSIAGVGAWAAVTLEPGDEIVDLSRYVVTPGFIDAHTHVTLPADCRTYEEMVAADDKSLFRIAAQNLRVHLACGVTTARDNGSREGLGVALRNAVASGELQGPRLLVSGPVVTKPRGHFHFCGIEANGVGEVRKAVDTLAASGVDHIKVMASGGDTAGTDPRAATYSVEELHALVETAHSYGLLTAAHCRATESMRCAVEAGLDCIEHAEFLRPDGRIELEQHTAELLAESNAYVSPTLPAYGQDSIVRLTEASAQRRLSEEERLRLTTAKVEIEAMLDSFGRMLQLGLGPRIIAGTDAGCADFSFGHIDYSASLMVRGGMTHMESIKACTSVAARALGLGDSAGVVRPGAQADLVVLGSDPLVRIGDIQDVRAVIQAGRTVVGDLHKLATAAELQASRPRATAAQP